MWRIMLTQFHGLRYHDPLIHKSTQTEARNCKMGVFPFRSLPFPCFAASSSCRQNVKVKYAIPKSSHDKFSTLTVQKFPRRLILQFLGFNHMACYLCPVLAVPMPEMKEPEVIRTVKLGSGVIIQDIVEGEGPEAHNGDLVEFNYVCRRSNGYFVYSTVDQFSGESKPVILPLDEKRMIEGLKDVLAGMRVGGKRRALIPASVGYINENLEPVPEEFGPRRSLFSHAKEPLVFEVQLLKIL